MTDQRNGTWVVVGAALAIIVVPTLIAVAIAIGTSGPDASDAPTPTTTTTTSGASVVAAPIVGDRLAEMEAGGELATMIELHQAMMDQMRVSATPQMLDLMNRDPMWQMLRSGEFTRVLEEHEQNIDRMLARGG